MAKASVFAFFGAVYGSLVNNVGKNLGKLHAESSPDCALARRPMADKVACPCGPGRAARRTDTAERGGPRCAGRGLGVTVRRFPCAAHCAAGWGKEGEREGENAG